VARPAVPRSPERHSAALGPTLALTSTLALAAFGLAMAVIMLNSTPLGVGFGKFENQSAETRSFAVAFLVVLPAAVLLVPMLADRIARGPNAAGLPVLAAAGAGTLAAAVVLLSVLARDSGLSAVLVAFGAWSVAFGAALARAASTRPWPALLGVGDRATAVWALAAALAVGAVLCFTSLGSISPVAVILGAIVSGAVLVAYSRRGDRPVARLPGRWGWVVDVGLIVLLALAIPNLVFFNAASGAEASISGIPTVIQYHHDLWLGPINELLAGRAILVDNASQYGIGPNYLGAAWFQLAPIGFGTLAFLDGLLYALFFATAYCVLRIAGISRPLAASALVLAVVVLVYNLVYPVGTIPQHGPLRFGPPMALILAAVAEARWPHRARIAVAGQLVVVGLAAVWSLEAFGYTLATYGAVICFRAWTRTSGGRLRWLAVRAGAALAAGAAANLAFVGLTLAFAGELPDYGQYWTFLHDFFFGLTAQFTFDYARWSPGLPLGFGYAASAMAFILVVRRRPDLVVREASLLTAICGVTAYGIVLYTYFVSRSENLVVPYVSLPAVIAGALWLGLLLRAGVVPSARVRLAALGSALVISVLVVAVAWSSTGDRFEHSPLGEALPGGRSLTGDLDALWHPPPLDPRAAEGERLLDRYMPGQDEVVMLVTPALGTEILIRSGRSNQLAFTDPVEDSYYGALGLDFVPTLGRSIDELHPGDRLLMQRFGLKVFRTLKGGPPRDVFLDPVPAPGALGGPATGGTLATAQWLLSLQEWALQSIGQRFDLQVSHEGPEGFVVARLVPG
jgi:hypothetical protein